MLSSRLVSSTLTEHKSNMGNYDEGSVGPWMEDMVLIMHVLHKNSHFSLFFQLQVSDHDLDSLDVVLDAPGRYEFRLSAWHLLPREERYHWAQGRQVSFITVP